MQILNDKELSLLSTERLLNIKRKLNKILGARYYVANTYPDTMVEADHRYLKSMDDYYHRVKSVLNWREHIESPKVRVDKKHDRKNGRDMKRKVSYE